MKVLTHGIHFSKYKAEDYNFLHKNTHSRNLEYKLNTGSIIFEGIANCVVTVEKIVSGIPMQGKINFDFEFSRSESLLKEMEVIEKKAKAFYSYLPESKEIDERSIAKHFKNQLTREILKTLPDTTKKSLRSSIGLSL